MNNSNEIRAALKETFATNRNQISVKKAGYGIEICVKSNDVDIAKLEAFVAENNIDAAVTYSDDVIEFHASNEVEIGEVLKTLKSNGIGFRFKGIAILYKDVNGNIDVHHINRKGGRDNIGNFCSCNPRSIAFQIALAEFDKDNDTTPPSRKVGDVLVDYAENEITIDTVIIDENRIYYQVNGTLELFAEDYLSYYLTRENWKIKRANEAAAAAARLAEISKWNDSGIDNLKPVSCKPFEVKCDMTDKCGSLKEHLANIEEGYTSKETSRCIGIIEVTPEQYELLKNNLYHNLTFLSPHCLGSGTHADFSNYVSFSNLNNAEQAKWRKFGFTETYQIKSENESFYISNWHNSYPRQIFTPCVNLAAATDLLSGSFLQLNYNYDLN
jgi:hypothetical protein